MKHHIITNRPPVFANNGLLQPINSVLQKRNSTNYSSSALFTHRHVIGVLHCIWFPKSQVIGDHVETIECSTASLFRTDIRSPHSRFTAALDGKTVFSKVDLVRAYHHIPWAKEDILLDLFEYTMMPCGLNNATQTFQGFMHGVCSGLDFQYVYLHDVLIASSSDDEHEKQLQHCSSGLKNMGWSSTLASVSPTSAGLSQPQN